MAKQKRSNHEGNIRERKDGRWEVRISSGTDFKTGKPKRSSYLCKTKAEAVEILQKMVYDIRINGYKDPATVTLAQWYELWLETYMKNSVKRSTYISYEGYLRNHFGPALGDVKLKNLTGILLQDFYNFKLEDGLSAKTIRNLNLALHKCLDFAKKEGLMLENPSEMISLPRQEDKEIEVLNVGQQTQLMQVSYRHRYGVFIRLTLCTGLRMGELLGLSWSEVDLTRGTLRIVKTLNRLKNIDEGGGNKTSIHFETPKTQNSRRSIPLPPSALAELKAWKQTQSEDAMLAACAYQNTGFVVTDELGRYIEPRTMKDHYNRILQDSGIGHFTFHALRHTFATRAMERNMDPKTLSTLLGHASVAFTLDTYAHCLDEQKRKGMALMDDIFGIGENVKAQQNSYPLIFTPNGEGFMITAPDFPKFGLQCAQLEEGLALAKEKLKKTLCNFKYLPVPSKNEDIGIPNGSFVVMLSA